MALMNMLNGIKKKSKINVAFVVNFASQKWLGGYNIIINLIETILIDKKSLINPILIIDSKSKVKIPKSLKKIKIIQTNFFSNISLFERIIEKLKILIFGKSLKYERFFLKHKIHILSHTILPLGKKSEVKSFPWIPDFQFLYYPKNFTKKNKLMKLINTFFCSFCSTNILLSSKEVKKDIKKISTYAFKKSKVNSFVFNMPKRNTIQNNGYLKKKFKIPNKFFYLPNQYWIHKNHKLVLYALSEAIKKNSSIFIVSTGYADDHRKSGYFNEISRVITKFKLENNYKYLGTVSYKDVMNLMYNSVAVINPSKFEGWSSSVEQAKSMGKEIILSNIKVHKEQNPERRIFFNPDNQNQISNSILISWDSYNKKKELVYINRAYQSLNQKLIKYARNYQEIILNKNSN